MKTETESRALLEVREWRAMAAAKYETLKDLSDEEQARHMQEEAEALLKKFGLNLERVAPPA
jgi:undecaprenyl pyrophosphate synthase